MLENWWLTTTLTAFGLISVFNLTTMAVRFQTTRLRNRHIRQSRRDEYCYSAELARLASQLSTSTSTSSLPWRILEVAEIIQESADCRSFYLVDPYRQSLPEFYPGQYVMVRPAMAGAYQTTRCYSLSSIPDPRYWRITVKLHPSESSARLEGGLSQWLHHRIGVGDCLFVGGPSGQFYLSPAVHGPVVLIAAGVGITPIASMLRWSIEATPRRAVTLFYQARSPDQWPLGQDLHSWQADCPQINVRSFFSGRAEEVDIASLQSQFPGHFEIGKFSGQSIAELTDTRQSQYYLCGPEAWMELIRDQMVAHGIDPIRIHWESFGGNPAVATEAPADARSVEFRKSQVSTQWSDPDQSLWELARANRIEIPSGCLSGVCGSCRVKLLAGQVVHSRKVAVELAPSECLACVAQPATNLVIDA